MPQRQNYLTYDQQRRTLLLTVANRDFVLCVSKNNLLVLFKFGALNNPTNRNIPHQPSAAYQTTLCQAYQSNLSYYGYQKGKKKGIYQIYDEDSDLYLKGFCTTLEQESKKIQYLDKGFDKMVADFVGIKTLCRKWEIFFFSKFRLHKY